MIDKDILQKLYVGKSLSVAQIVKLLDSSRFVVDKSMLLHEIPRRSASDTAFLQHNKQFFIKTNLSDKERVLYGVGLGLYWGEGNKVDAYSVRLGNTDPSLLVTFKNFLTNICGVAESDIKYGLQIFNDSDPEISMEFWLKILNCKREAFHKTISVIPPQGKGNYKRKNIYGVAQIYVGNKKLKTWLMNEIAEYAAVAQG